MGWSPRGGWGAGAAESARAADTACCGAQQDGNLADGHCWELCCPSKNWDPIGRCQNQRTVALNATLNKGCDPSCDQHGKQDINFQRIKATARSAGRPEPHAMLYMNSVYDWPFDAAHAKHADVLDINGHPHAEQCDPGIYPSFFLDHGRQAGQEAFQAIFQKYIVDGAADGYACTRDDLCRGRR